MVRLVIASIVGGVIVFGWGAASHMALPLGKAGWASLPDDTRLIGSLKQALPHSGLYMIPTRDFEKQYSAEEEASLMAKCKQGPFAILAYTAEGIDPMSPRNFVTEFLSSVLAAGVAALALSMVTASYLKRAGVVALFALFGWLSLSVSYWNWYRFPTDYIVAEGITEVVGWLLAGLALAKIVPVPRVSQSPA
jgi:hypothetical protein